MFSLFIGVYEAMKGQTIIQKIVRFHSLWFFDELFELIGILRGIHHRLIKRNSTTVRGVYDNTKVLIYGLALGRGLLYQGSCHDSSNGSRSPIQT